MMELAKFGKLKIEEEKETENLDKERVKEVLPLVQLLLGID